MGDVVAISARDSRCTCHNGRHPAVLILYGLTGTAMHLCRKTAEQTARSISLILMLDELKEPPSATNG